MSIFSFLRLKGRPASPKSPPQRGYIDLFHDSANNRIVAMDDRGNNIPIGNGSGETPVTTTTTSIAVRDSDFTPETGTLAERIRSSGTGVTLTTGDTATVASIALTSGVWLIQGFVEFTMTGATVTSHEAGMNPVTPGFGASGKSGLQLTTTTTENTVTIPSLSGGVGLALTYYLAARATFSAGTISTSGTITATRIA